MIQNYTPIHPSEDILTSVEIKAASFLAPYIMQIKQTMDQSVIQTLKTFCRKQLSQLLSSENTVKDSFKQIKYCYLLFNTK